MFLLALLFQLYVVWAAVPGPAFHGIPTQVHDVVTSDGAHEKVYELEGNDNSENVILLEPGFMENPSAMDGAAASWHSRGYKVLIGQIRLAGSKEFRSTGGKLNGLEDIFLKSIPAHLREAIRIAGPGRMISYLGHSMGGAAIAAVFSNRELSAEFSPHIKSVAMLNAPVDFKRIPGFLRFQVGLLTALLKKAHGYYGKDTLDPVNTIFELIDKMKKSPNILTSAAGRVIEKKVYEVSRLVVGQTLIDAEHTSPEAIARLMREELAAVPLPIAISWGEAVAAGQVMGRDGKPLIDPAKITVPLQMTYANKDILVPEKSQEKFFDRLGSSTKQLVYVDGIMHVTLLVTDNPKMDIMPTQIDFANDPVASAAKEMFVTWPPLIEPVHAPVCTAGGVLKLLTAAKK